MSAFSDYLENAILNHIFGDTDYARPDHLYVGLFTAEPGENDTSGEIPQGGGYTRSEIVFGNAVSGSISNTNEVLFPEASADWGVITHFAIFDSQEGGNMLVKGTFDIPKMIYFGDTVRIKAGELTISVD